LTDRRGGYTAVAYNSIFGLVFVLAFSQLCGQKSVVPGLPRQSPQKTG